ncbi:MAG: alpha-glucuronidase family glycosyl hydrolase [Terrimicrobiaceae bacterium]
MMSALTTNPIHNTGEVAGCHPKIAGSMQTPLRSSAALDEPPVGRLNLSELSLGQEAWLSYRPLQTPTLEPGGLRWGSAFPCDKARADAVSAEWESARRRFFPGADPAVGSVALEYDAGLGGEAFAIRCHDRHQVSIRSGGSVGALYGVFRLIRSLQTGEAEPGWVCAESPAIPLRAFLHFDNIWPKVDIERGYGGESLWKWALLPADPGGRYRDYGRLLASIGMNAVILNNVNAGEPGIGGWRLITSEWIPRVAAIAEILRPWGVRVGLSVAYNSPELAGDLSTSDPRDTAVQMWWAGRASEIYSQIPDFLGWVVKADSEGQAGPMTHGLDHASGSRALADALAPHGGRLFWRCFVYGHEAVDITAQPYRQFRPLDGCFADNTSLLIKNGPRDFQVREPLHPLFGAMPETSCALELQATQEYLGHDTHLVFLPSQWEEVFSLPVQDGTAFRDWLPGQKDAAIFAVANVNDSPCWTGHIFGQANWYGFGRMAWDPALSADRLAREWEAMTFGTQGSARSAIARILLESWRVFEGYTAPLCLGQIYNSANTWDADHFDPDPWRNNGSDWFYAGPGGVGIPRATQDHFLQYPPAFRRRVADATTCDPDYLLWFHRLPWDWVMPDGRSILQTLCDIYRSSAERVDDWILLWQGLHCQIDPHRHAIILDRLLRQRLHARLWSRYMMTYLCEAAASPPNPKPEDTEIQGACQLESLS